MNESTTYGEKRQHPRFKVEGATTVMGQPGFLSSLGFGPIRHPIVNLSQGGAMVRLGKRSPAGSRHELRPEFPKHHAIVETMGEVRWCAQNPRNASDFFVGVQFVDLSPDEQEKIAGITDPARPA